MYVSEKPYTNQSNMQMFNLFDRQLYSELVAHGKPRRRQRQGRSPKASTPKEYGSFQDTVFIYRLKTAPHTFKSKCSRSHGEITCKNSLISASLTIW